MTPGKITYWFGTGKVGPGNPEVFSRAPTKPEALKLAKQYMEEHPPSGEYDSVQIVPYTAEGRKWGMKSQGVEEDGRN
jgi:hypothetical protein